VQRLRLAHEREFADLFADCEIGTMPPFGNLYGLPVYVDRELTRNKTIVCPAGTHTDTINILYADFARLAQPIITDFVRPRFLRSTHMEAGGAG
jgi:Ala-tRNA(Pro) deacylase